MTLERGDGELEMNEFGRLVESLPGQSRETA